MKVDIQHEDGVDRLENVRLIEQESPNVYLVDFHDDTNALYKNATVDWVFDG